MHLPYLRISLTKDCNAACGFCHNEGQAIGERGLSVTTKNTQLSLDDYKYIADFFVSEFVKVKFTGGEPTLIGNLPEIISVFSSRGYQTSVTSNGFRLTAQLQHRLKIAGLSYINVSIPSLMESQYDRIFGVNNQLPKVLENLEFLGNIFEKRCKVNFVGFLNSTVPNQIKPFSDLSADKKVTVSCLSLVGSKEGIANNVKKFLFERIGVLEVIEYPDDFGFKQLFYLKNGGVWEFDDFRTPEYQVDAFNNLECQKCHFLSRCTEGPYALRVTEEGNLKPCLIRNDNVTFFKNGRFLLADTMFLQNEF
jgi:GTP 3',8-cyclase